MSPLATEAPLVAGAGIVYRSRGYGFSDEDAQRIGPVLRQLREHILATGGEESLKLPPLIVEEASRADSPIHGDFEWNDRIAATKQRLERASVMMRAIFTDRPSENGTGPLEVRAFVPVRMEGARNEFIWAADEEVRARPDLRTRKQREALSRLRGWVRFAFAWVRDDPLYAPLFREIERLEVRLSAQTAKSSSGESC